MLLFNHPLAARHALENLIPVAITIAVLRALRVARAPGRELVRVAPHECSSL